MTRATTRRPASPSKRVAPLFVIACEGDTEIDYLQAWQRQLRGKVRMTFLNCDSHPKKIVDAVVKEKRSDSKSRDPAQYWAVFDRDEHDQIPNAIRKARDNHVQVAFSNPCLELWFIIHFRNQTGYLDRYEAQRASRKLIKCDKHLTEHARSELLVPDRYRDAHSRARSLERKHKGDGTLLLESNPGTSIWRLVDAVKEAAMLDDSRFSHDPDSDP